ncbi:ATP-binding protein [Acinetobacter sp.]|uniref:ATP-binding protein n=1 Tax=Acinetobacter sp. TaxID=472 RepID=UPI002FD87FEB
MSQQDLFASFAPRFMDNFLGAMGKDPIIAITELIANAWDARSKNVYIKWSVGKDLANPRFEIKDDGDGLSYDEFQKIWAKLNYDRIANQGEFVSLYDDLGNKLETRAVFGKNGKGRLSPFCFNDFYHITSIKNGNKFSCTVTRANDTESTPFSITDVKNNSTSEKNGLYISTPISKISNLIDVDELRKELSARFIARPTFKIFVNETELTLNDIPSECVHTEQVEFKGHPITIKLIDTNKADTSTKQRGVAWWVQGRLVGDINWSFLKNFDVFDQRSTAAKKLNLIIEADCLHTLDLVLPDWSNFNQNTELWREFEELMIPTIKNLMQNIFEKESLQKANKVLNAVRTESDKLGNFSKSKITAFVDETVRSCPSLTDKVLFNITNILINLEKSSNKFNLIQKLANISTEELDKLDSILEDWGVDMAKIILDEIEGRLKTIAEFEARTQIIGIKEVQELQTLFNNGLWMFGANFEAIDFSSNKGMSTVFKTLFNQNIKASKNRPDYVILPEAFSRPKFDDETHDEIGVDHVVIVDLKTTGLWLGSTEKDQIWKYVKELESKGSISKTTKVHGFILGDKIESGESSPRKEWNDNVVITPILYSTLLSRAKNRMLRLSDKVSSAPILKSHIKEEEQRLSEVYSQNLPI